MLRQAQKDKIILRQAQNDKIILRQAQNDKIILRQAQNDKISLFGLKIIKMTSYNVRRYSRGVPHRKKVWDTPGPQQISFIGAIT